MWKICRARTKTFSHTGWNNQLINQQAVYRFTKSAIMTAGAKKRNLENFDESGIPLSGKPLVDIIYPP